MKLYSAVDGDPTRPVLVLSNSLGTTLEMWEPQLSALTRTHPVVRYDHRGHGRSPVPPGPYTVAELGRDVLELIDELDVDRVSFCGLSIGGVVGIWLACHVPDRLDRLVLACTRLSYPHREWNDRATVVRADGVVAIADAVLGRWFIPSFRDSSPTTVERFRSMLTETSVEGYAACCDALAGLDLSDMLSSITAPTLVLSGSDDPAAPPDLGAHVAASIVGASHAVIAGGAHIANVEQPEAFTAQLLEHLTREARI